MVCFKIEAVGRQLETCTKEARASPQKDKGRPDSASMAVTPSAMVLLARSATPFCCGLFRTVCCLEIPASVVKQRNAEDMYSPPLSLRRALIFAFRWFLAYDLNAKECFKGVRLRSKREYNAKSSEVIYEGHPVAKSRVSAHRERPMKIRMNEFKRVSCLGLRWRKGIGMHLARQAGLANGIWGEF